MLFKGISKYIYMYLVLKVVRATYIYIGGAYGHVISLVRSTGVLLAF